MPGFYCERVSVLCDGETPSQPGQCRKFAKLLRDSNLVDRTLRDTDCPRELLGVAARALELDQTAQDALARTFSGDELAPGDQDATT